MRILLFQIKGDVRFREVEAAVAGLVWIGGVRSSACVPASSGVSALLGVVVTSRCVAACLPVCWPRCLACLQLCMMACVKVLDRQKLFRCRGNMAQTSR